MVVRKKYVMSRHLQPNTNYALWKYSIERKFSMYDNFTTLRLSYICDKSDKFTAFLIKHKAE